MISMRCISLPKKNVFRVSNEKKGHKYAVGHVCCTGVSNTYMGGGSVKLVPSIP